MPLGRSDSNKMPTLKEGDREIELSAELAAKILNRNFPVHRQAALRAGEELIRELDDDETVQPTDLVRIASEKSSSLLTPSSTRNVQPTSYNQPAGQFYSASGAATVGKLVGRALVAAVVKWLLNESWEELSEEDLSGEGGERKLRREEDDLVFDSGPSGYYFADGQAPSVVYDDYNWDGGCCEDKGGIEVCITYEMSDDSGDFWENDTGIREIEVNAHDIVDRDENNVKTSPIDSELKEGQGAGYTDFGEEGKESVEIKGCIPCSYFESEVDHDNYTVLTSIKVKDWNDNWRMKKKELSISEDLYEECCD